MKKTVLDTEIPSSISEIAQAAGVLYNIHLRKVWMSSTFHWYVVMGSWELLPGREIV